VQGLEVTGLIQASSHLTDGCTKPEDWRS